MPAKIEHLIVCAGVLLAVGGSFCLGEDSVVNGMRWSTIEKRASIPDIPPDDDRAYKVRKIFEEEAASEHANSKRLWKDALAHERALHGVERSHWHDELERNPDFARDEARYRHEVPRFHGRERDEFDAKERRDDAIRASVQCMARAFEKMPIADPECVRPKEGTHRAGDRFDAAAFQRQSHRSEADAHLAEVERIYREEVTPRYLKGKREELRRGVAAMNVAYRFPDIESHRRTATEAAALRDNTNEQMARWILRAQTHAVATENHLRMAGLTRHEAGGVVARRLFALRYVPGRLKRLAPKSVWHGRYSGDVFQDEANPNMIR